MFVGVFVGFPVPLTFICFISLADFNSLISGQLRFFCSRTEDTLLTVSLGCNFSEFDTRYRNRPRESEQPDSFRFCSGKNDTWRHKLSSYYCLHNLCSCLVPLSHKLWEILYCVIICQNL